jgi:DNA polymerase elongation subunit (family B)
MQGQGQEQGVKKKKKMVIIKKPTHSYRLFDFNSCDTIIEDHNSNSESSESECKKCNYKDAKQFVIQMFGINEKGNTCSIVVTDMHPFFYIKVDEMWKQRDLKLFIIHLKAKIGNYYSESIIESECKLVKKKKLYGFDGGANYTFILLTFKNMATFNKVKNFWYSECESEEPSSTQKYKSFSLNKDGYEYEGRSLVLYEAHIPPMLRFFHIKNISPTGWVIINSTPLLMEKKTTCCFEYNVVMSEIEAQPNKEDRVPYKICSFDIEASSSHGDFPLAIKSYKKLASNIVDECAKAAVAIDEQLIRLLATIAFFPNMVKNNKHKYDIQKVFIKNQCSFSFAEFNELLTKWLSQSYMFDRPEEQHVITIESMFERMGEGNDDDNDENEDEYNCDDVVEIEVGKKWNRNKFVRNTNTNSITVLEILNSKTLSREKKIIQMNMSLANTFPNVEGDKVTFIGTTFMRHGENSTYLNHCATMFSCAESENIVTRVCDNERELLLEWTRLIQEEDPDIIIGYNIFGFDYSFMFHRAIENGCEEEFLKLSRNIDYVCGTRDRDTDVLNIEESSIMIASGQHDLRYIKMPGRTQIDMYNYLRREYTSLSSYKLDHVAGHFIGEAIKNIDFETENATRIHSSGTLMGLNVGNFVHFEEHGNSMDYYKDGKKFKVTSIDGGEGKSFCIEGREELNIKHAKVKWCIAKDDVTPQDIFRMTNEGPNERAIIAKYCIQDCNLVHNLLKKIDVITGYVEMGNICSVPISYLVFRGQGIKTTSFVAKKCRENNTLIPVLDKKIGNESYDGAIVLPPKCDLYLDNPVACVDYASLYPSSMISENLSHDSKVWTKEYNLKGELICVTGECDEGGKFKYDELPGYTYVDVTYDTYVWIKNQRGKSVKHANGIKVCRFAQFPQGKAIMPNILEELLAARSATRKLMAKQTDDFMKNVLDKRQLGYKITANSLYGQCGAKTSTIYEIDVAASTTATGRKLLTYAKRVVEETYGNAECQTSKYGVVNTRAEHVYGDSVGACTPVYVRFGGDMIDVCPIEALAEKYGAGWTYCKEEGKQTKQVCEMMCGVETWSEKGWTRLHRVIRHVLAPHKKMMRIVTHTGIVDVTDDHSLILSNGEEISPKNVEIGTKLLHCALPQPTTKTMSSVTVEQARIMGFFFGDGSCGEYSWVLNASMEFIHQYLELCKIAYPHLEWVVSGVYNIVPKSKKSGSLVEFVNFYRSMMYYKQCKIIPSIIINNTQEIRESFWNGMYDADGHKDENGYTRVDQKNQISAACICLLAQSIGLKTSLNTRSDKMDIYRMTMTKRTQRICADSIKTIITLPVEENQYVYDLTTDNHHFAAGIGNMIVHNTDSVFFTFNLADKDGAPIRGKQALEITIELAQQVGELASSFLKAPHSLVYEKSIMPFCLLRKKGYVGIYYETNPNKGSRKSMGIVLKRRDNAPIVKDVYGGIIDILMNEQNVLRAIEFLKTYMRNLIQEKIPLEKLIVTKSLNSNYKNPQQIAHKVLADRMGQRDPGNKPNNGDRIPYVYIHTHTTAAKAELQGDKIEHPLYIMQNKLKPNYVFYITNQIMKPVLQLFGLVLEKIPEFKKRENNYKHQVELLKSHHKNDETVLQQKINELRHKEVKILLFDEYLIESQNAVNKNQSIKSFFKPAASAP